MIKSHKLELLSLLGTMGKMAELLPKMETHSEQIQDILDACECIKENLKGETAPKSTELLQAIETSLKENKLNILDYAKKLKSSFDSEVKANKEALFLPYKVSMWDSLESIYLAAKEGPNWDALVMPIPYYDKKDGKFTEMHWEINYPKNTNLVDYRKYNIEERKPDAIFIHNPYDNRNIVTSVHPDFYSERLRNFTKNLVYVPYFVGDGINIQEHFCTVPACIFAHKVIVQTEAEREIYVREYIKVTRDRSNKFLALGSPKLDKAATAKKEDYEIPPEWEKLISNKKVVFYNLSIGALLEYTIENGRPSGKYFQKVRKVFEFFKKQSYAVLLWRPHPLLESTIKSMRPWLEAEYAEIVREYKSGGYGIYDDTADLNRSIAISDVYYGDWSSVIRLFEAVRKKICIQSFGLLYIYGIYADENFIWFTNSSNVLCKYDKQSKKTECLAINAKGSHSVGLNIAENNEKLYFAPYYRNSEISIFDKEKKVFKQIAFKDYDKFDSNFQNIISYNNFIYFIPYNFPDIMRLNTDTDEIEYFSQWRKAVSKLQTYKLQEEFWKKLNFFHSRIVGKEIAIFIYGTNAVMFFNMETCSYEFKYIGEKSEQYNDVCLVGQNYYFSLIYENYVVKWNSQTNKISKIKLPSSFSRKASKNISFFMQYSNEHIWLFPVVANNAYKIDINTDEITELPELVEHFGNKELECYYNVVFACENYIYASTLCKGIVEYCTDTRELNFISACEEDSEKNFLLYMINSRENESNKIITETESSGKKIWKYIGGGK